MGREKNPSSYRTKKNEERRGGFDRHKARERKIKKMEEGAEDMENVNLPSNLQDKIK